ncbi:26S protease regulatory subunit 10B [Ameca splendens]|uniref:26S protease regulatory subunit 10B n=1 Tax=Ameca splendens TaxID=208324 RepID=A0ABV0ZPL9_9TELE
MYKVHVSHKNLTSVHHWASQTCTFIVKATNGPRYVVGCRRQLDKSQLKPGTRVALDMTTLTIMRYLPREVDPLVYNMSHEDPGSVSYSEIGGLSEQIRELREVQLIAFLSNLFCNVSDIIYTFQYALMSLHL